MANFGSTAGKRRDIETIDSELRLIAAVRRSIREHGGEPSSRQVDELLDERLAHGRRAGEDAAVDTQCQPVHHCAAFTKHSRCLTTG
jgi:hypothetical protein